MSFGENERYASTGSTIHSSAVKLPHRLRVDCRTYFAAGRLDCHFLFPCSHTLTSGGVLSCRRRRGERRMDSLEVEDQKRTDATLTATGPNPSEESRSRVEAFTYCTVCTCTGGPFMARTWFGEIGPCCCLPPLLNLPAAFSEPRANHKGVPSTGLG